MKKILLLFICINLNAQIVLQKADNLLSTGNYQDALVILDNEQEQTFEILNKKGNIYQQIGNYTKAINQYEKALILNNSIKTKENLGKCYQKNNKSDKAILLFEEVLIANNQNSLLKYHLAKLYKSKKDFKKAKLLFKSLIETDNTNPNYYYYLGSTYLNLKEKDSAKIQFLSAIKNDSTHFKSLYNLAKQYRKVDKYRKLRKQFKNKLPKFNNDTSYFYLNKGLQFYPKSNALLRLAAKYYLIDENYPKVIENLVKMERLNGDEKHDLAISYYFEKDYEKAKDYLYDLIETRKATSKTFFYLALIYKAEKDYEKAELYMQTSIDAEQPQLTEFYFEFGLIYQEAKNYTKAIANFKKALEDSQFNYKAQYQLALTCDSFYKDKTIALKHYEYYLKKFTYKDGQTTAFVKQRVEELKTMIFMKK